MELVPESKRIKKKNVVNLACNFCKKRHLKCDGSIPCVQCVSRNEECIFSNNLKRGRKSTKENELAVKLPSPVNPLQISASDETFHHTYFMKFIERIAPVFPYFTPRCFSLEVSPFFSIKMNDKNITWNSIQQLTPTSAKKKSISELMNIIEYTLSCAHGSRLCNPSSDIGDMFIEKTENLLQLLGTNLEADPSLANHLLLLYELTGFYFFSMSRNLDSAQKCAYHNLHSYTIYNLYKPHISPDIANRMFFYLAGTTNDLADAYHFIKKVKLSSNSYANCINVLVGVGAVGSATVIRPDKDATAKLRHKVFNKLLTLMRECELMFAQNPLPTLPWLATMWAIEKAFVLYKLNLPYEEQPLDLLTKLVSLAPTLLEKRPGNPGVFHCMIFMLLIIPRSQLPSDIYTFCMNVLNDRDIQYPGLIKFLRCLNEEDARIVQIEEKSDSSDVIESPSQEIDYSELIANVEDIEALLINNDFLNV